MMRKAPPRKRRQALETARKRRKSKDAPAAVGKVEPVAPWAVETSAPLAEEEIVAAQEMPVYQATKPDASRGTAAQLTRVIGERFEAQPNSAAYLRVDQRWA